jgi:replication factor C subunit 1
MLKDLS